ncbi:methyltransferase domain-containing protein [Candidatus Bathyarchaeota archaeon]|nr:methyltransferase domain-containing protein [Candidatus Bathyarchaeota archaeon]
MMSMRDIMLQGTIQTARKKARRNILKYTMECFSHVNVGENPLIFDMGCGDGMVSIELARHFHGRVIGIDKDLDALNQLKDSLMELPDASLRSRVQPIHSSFTWLRLLPSIADMIWSEGSIHFIGFKRALATWKKYLQLGGTLGIHAALGGESDRRKEFKKHGFSLEHEFKLPGNTWWNEYYTPLHDLARGLEQEAGYSLLRHASFINLKNELQSMENNERNRQSVIYILRYHGGKG